MPKVKVKNTALKQRNLLGILSKARRAVLNDIIARSTYRLSARLRKSINHFEEMNNRFDALIMGYVLEEPLGALEKIFLHDYLDLNNSYDTLVLSQFFSASAHQATREQIENFKKEVKKKNDDFNQFIKIFILDSRPDNANKKRFLARLKAIENEFTTFINQLS